MKALFGNISAQPNNERRIHLAGFGRGRVKKVLRGLWIWEPGPPLTRTHSGKSTHICQIAVSALSVRCPSLAHRVG